MDWEALARATVARRVELGYPTRNAFIAASGISARTIGDIETARRTSYARETLIRLERALRWAPGSAYAVLDGGEPKPVVDGQSADLSLDPRSLERYGDELELLQVIAEAGLSPGDALKVTLRLRAVRAAQHQELLARLRDAVDRLKAGDGSWADMFEQGGVG